MSVPSTDPDKIAPMRPPSLARQLSRSSLPLTLVRSAEVHPHHAHFEVPEQEEGSSSHEKHEPQGRSSHETHEPQGRSSHEKHEPQGSPAHTPGDGGHGVHSGGGGKLVIDIEHVPVEDDPREWSAAKKNWVLAGITISILGPLIAPSIYNPVIDEVKADLMGTDTEIGLSLSLYIIFQGYMPLLWSTMAEIWGRKRIYLGSYAIYFVTIIIGSRASTMPVFIAMRCLQAVGSSAVTSVGAGSLADIFEVHERGQKLGVFYGMPLLGPSIGPLIGGALGNAFGWRSAFYFLAAFAGVCEVMFVFLPDTWRRERSKVYQVAMERAVARAIQHDESKERKRQRKLAMGLPSTAATAPTTAPGTPRRQSEASGQGRDHVEGGEKIWEAADSAITGGAAFEETAGSIAAPASALARDIVIDPEKGETVVRRWWRFGRPQTEEEHEKIRPSFRDLNPFPMVWSIYKRPTNALVLLASGVIFAAQYVIPYTASITLARPPYSYNALYIGLVILSFGVGCVFGSIGGGKYSDVVLAKLKRANGGVSNPEMRLKSTIPAMPFLIAAFLAYGWTAGEKVNIAGLIVSLFFCGLTLMTVYSSSLAYIVDANPGRSAGAVACNSLIRGSFGCILSQTAIPLQNALGDGGLWSLIAGLLALSCASLLLVAVRGQSWRSPDHLWPWQRSSGREDTGRSGTATEDGTAASTHGAAEDKAVESR